MEGTKFDRSAGNNYYHKYVILKSKSVYVQKVYSFPCRVLIFDEKVRHNRTLNKKKFRFWSFGGFCSIAKWYHRPQTKIATVTKNWSLGGSFSKLYMMISPINQDEHTTELSIT